jgi:hypothetical protein
VPGKGFDGQFFETASRIVTSSDQTACVMSRDTRSVLRQVCGDQFTSTSEPKMSMSARADDCVRWNQATDT